MLSSISWTQYILFIAGATALWMLYVLRLYMAGRRQHQREVEASESPPVKRVWSVEEKTPEQMPGISTGPEPAATPTPQHFPYMPSPLPIERMDYQVPQMETEEQDEEDYSTLESIAMEMSDITSRLGIQTTDQELLDTIRLALEKYPSLDAPHHQIAVGKLIRRCALQDCGIALSPEQVSSLWETPPQEQ